MNSKQVVLWVLAILIVNVTWAFVSQSEASYEINSSSQTEAEREVNIAEFFGFSKPIPSRLEMTFYSIDAEDKSFSYSLGNTQTSIAQGTGLAPASLVWNGEIKPGEYIMNFESTGSVTTDQTLYTQPFMPYRLNGHIVASLCLIVLSFAEVAIKGVLQSRKTRSADASQTFEKKGTQSSGGTPYADDEQSPWRDPIVL